jgi:hypothetical protein
MTDPTQEQLIAEAIRILALSESAHRGATPEGKERFRKALWALEKDYRVFIGRLYDFGKEFRGTDMDVITYWDAEKANIEQSGLHIVPHILHDPMTEMYICRALGILQAEGVLNNTGVERVSA